jgi:hypothetical protein
VGNTSNGVILYRVFFFFRHSETLSLSARP